MQSFRFSSILWGCFLIGKVLSVSLDYVGMDPKPVLCDMSERQHELEFRNKEVVQWESNELATTWGCESSRTQRCISSEQEQWSKTTTWTISGAMALKFKITSLFEIQPSLGGGYSWTTGTAQATAVGFGCPPSKDVLSCAIGAKVKYVNITGEVRQVVPPDCPGGEWSDYHAMSVVTKPLGDPAQTGLKGPHGPDIDFYGCYKNCESAEACGVAITEGLELCPGFKKPAAVDEYYKQKFLEGWNKIGDKNKDTPAAPAESAAAEPADGSDLGGFPVR